MHADSRLRGPAVFVLAALVALAAPALAVPADGPVAALHFGVTQVEWSPQQDYAGLSLTVSGPNGIERTEYAAGEAPLFDLAAMSGDVDGQYTWELRATPKLDDATRRAIAALRSDATAVDRPRPAGLPPADELVQSGAFQVMDGAIVQPTEESSPRLVPEAAGPASAAGALGVVTGEQIISGDLVVYNSICVGFDCPSNPSFGADTIRMQENNLRIHAEDTSTAAGFPTTDWRLEFNSQNSGGGSYFRVIDASASRNIMTLEANAPSHSLYVDSGGRVGMGTSNPVVELHVVDGDTPTLRLQQDTSSGFASQTWDVAGNETSFFVRDATNGSTLPFRIRPGASSNSLVIDSDNDIGIGTLSPSARLQVVRTASGNAELAKLTNNGPIDFVMERTDIADRDWRFESENAGFFISRIGSGDTEFALANNGDLEIAGDLTANGTNYPSSRSLKENFATVDSREVLERLTAVPVSLWNYKSDADKQTHIGPVTEDFSQAFDFLHIDGKLNTIDLHGIAMAAIQGLQQEVQEKNARIDELEQRISALEARQSAASTED